MDLTSNLVAIDLNILHIDFCHICFLKTFQSSVLCITACPNLSYKPVNQREDLKCFISHTPRQSAQCTNIHNYNYTQVRTQCPHNTNTPQTERKWKRDRKKARGSTQLNTQVHTHTHTHKKKSTSSQEHLHSLESRVDLGLSPWVSSQPKGNMMARYWLFHCLPNNCVLEYMQYDAVTCAD